MPNQRPARPITSDGRISVSEMNRLARQAAQGNRVTAAPPLKVSQGQSGYHFSLDTSGQTFPARLTNVVTGTGAQAGLNLYGFVEQRFDPATGLPIDAAAGRSADPSASPLTSYALEIDNRLVPGLTGIPPSVPLPAWSTPLPSPLPYPYVEMRLKGIVNGSPVYEFALPQPPPVAWVKVTSATAQTITLASGTLTGYAAVVDTQSPTTGAWSDGVAVWFLGVNGEVPTVGTRYQCRKLGADTSGVAIWEAEFFAGSNALNIIYLTSTGSGTTVTLPTMGTGSGQVPDGYVVWYINLTSSVFTFSPPAGYTIYFPLPSDQTYTSIGVPPGACFGFRLFGSSSQWLVFDNNICYTQTVSNIVEADGTHGTVGHSGSGLLMGALPTSTSPPTTLPGPPTILNMPHIVDNTAKTLPLSYVLTGGGVYNYPSSDNTYPQWMDFGYLLAAYNLVSRVSSGGGNYTWQISPPTAIDGGTW